MNGLSLAETIVVVVLAIGASIGLVAAMLYAITRESEPP